MSPGTWTNSRLLGNLKRRGECHQQLCEQPTLRQSESSRPSGSVNTRTISAQVSSKSSPWSQIHRSTDRQGRYESVQDAVHAESKRPPQPLRKGNSLCRDAHNNDDQAHHQNKEWIFDRKGGHLVTPSSVGHHDGGHLRTNTSCQWGGINGGAGLTFIPSRFGSVKLYTEVRYVWTNAKLTPEQANPSPISTLDSGSNSYIPSHFRYSLVTVFPFLVTEARSAWDVAAIERAQRGPRGLHDSSNEGHSIDILLFSAGAKA